MIQLGCEPQAGVLVQEGIHTPFSEFAAEKMRDYLLPLQFPEYAVTVDERNIAVKVIDIITAKIIASPGTVQFVEPSKISCFEIQPFTDFLTLYLQLQFGLEHIHIVPPHHS